MSSPEQLRKAFDAFDAYNSKDPNKEVAGGSSYPKELLYGLRMTSRLMDYVPEPPESVQLAARCQHIGRWELPRNSFPMDRKGYLQWRSKLALHHSALASKILRECSFDSRTIADVQFLLQKKQLLQHHPETQMLEDVICLVFIEHYLEDFALQHEEDKVVEILKKTIKKMSPRALKEAMKINLSENVSPLLEQALQ
jgi:hypothetical protein